MPTGDTYANAYLDASLGTNHTVDFPSTVYFALYAGSADDPDNELSGGGYARTAIPNNSSNWPDAVDRQKTNALEIVLPLPTANWVEATEWAIHGHITNHDPIHSEELTEPLAGKDDVEIRIPPESLVIQIPT